MGRVYLRNGTWCISTTIGGKRLRRAVSKSRSRALTILKELEDRQDAVKAQTFLEETIKNDCNGTFAGV